MCVCVCVCRGGVNYRFPILILAAKYNLCVYSNKPFG